MTADPAGPGDPPTVSVVIAAYSMERWDDLRTAMATVQEQTVPVLETVVVIDHNPALLARALREFSAAIVLPNAGCRGASGARNTGVAVSHSEVVAFLDDDAVASAAWLERLLPHFSNPSVVGAGGRLIPLWEKPRPRWFPAEFDWVVGGSYRGMPKAAVAVRNVWSGNMAIRRQVFDDIGGFRDGFGKVGGHSCPEDTDLCLRAAASLEGGRWIYEPAAMAGHRVPQQRATLRYFLTRSYSEGRGKAALAGLDGTGQSTSAERRYTHRVLPAGVGRGLREAIRGDLTGAARSLAIAVGLALAVVGFIAGHADRMTRPETNRRSRRAFADGQLRSRPLRSRLPRNRLAR